MVAMLKNPVGGDGGGLLHGEPRAVWSGIKFSHCWLARIHNSCAFLLAEENGKCAVLFPPTLSCSLTLAFAFVFSFDQTILSDMKESKQALNPYRFLGLLDFHMPVFILVALC